MTCPLYRLTTRYHLATVDSWGAAISVLAAWLGMRPAEACIALECGRDGWAWNGRRGTVAGVTVERIGDE